MDLDKTYARKIIKALASGNSEALMSLVPDLTVEEAKNYVTSYGKKMIEMNINEQNGISNNQLSNELTDINYYLYERGLAQNSKRK